MNKANMLSIWIISVSLLVLILGQSTIHAEDATVDDVLKGKTFSNSNATGLEGIRPPAPVERTGQTYSYQVNDDGFHETGVPWPDPRFSAGEEVVTDNLTGLMWQKSLNTQRMNWWSAVNICQGLVILEGPRPVIEYKDWRLPNIKELLSLIDYGRYDPPLPSGHPFTDVQISYPYWSSTFEALNYPSTDLKWTVSFQKGLVEPLDGDPSTWMYTWCVRGEYGDVAFDIDGDGKEGLPEAVHALQVVAGIIPPSTDNATVDDVLKGKTFSNSSATGLEGVRPPAPVERTRQKITLREGDDGFHEKGISWPDPRFSAGEEVVTDNLTGLMWQKYLNTAAMNWGSAINYCNQLSIMEFVTTYQDWRLPNRQELLSLIDYGEKRLDGPTLPSGHPFSGISTTMYCWESTSVAGAEDAAWYVWFASGNSLYTAKSVLFRAWCVRGGN